MKIPFDIKFRPQIESGEYKVAIEYDNRTFYPRIVCWDFNSTELLACVNYGDREDVLEYDSSGKHIGKSVGRPDLIIITPEPELTDWVKFISGCLQKHGLLDCGAADRIAKDCSAELLELARKEIMDGWSRGLRDTQDLSGKAYNDGYQLGFERGKAEALKDLPRWRKWGNGACGNGRGIPLAIVKRELNDYELIDALGIQGEQYIMLSDLEKLPGFNE